MEYPIKFSHYGEEREIHLNEEETQAVKIIFEMLEALPLIWKNFKLLKRVTAMRL